MPQYWSPSHSLGFVAQPFHENQGGHAAAAVPFHSPSPQISIVPRLVRARTADIHEKHDSETEYGPLGNALNLPARARLPAVSVEAALAHEAARLLQSDTKKGKKIESRKILNELDSAAASRYAGNADAKWAALLALRRADKNAARALADQRYSARALGHSGSLTSSGRKLMAAQGIKPPGGSSKGPTSGILESALERFFHVADEIAPLGILGHAQFEVALTAVYGAKVAHKWASLVSSSVSNATGIANAVELPPFSPIRASTTKGANTSTSGLISKGQFNQTDGGYKNTNIVNNDTEEDEKGIRVKRIVDKMSGLNIVAAPRTVLIKNQSLSKDTDEEETMGRLLSGAPLPTAFLKLDDATIVRYLAHSGGPGKGKSPGGFLMAAIKRREEENVIFAAEAAANAHATISLPPLVQSSNDDNNNNHHPQNKPLEKQAILSSSMNLHSLINVGEVTKEKNVLSSESLSQLWFNIWFGMATVSKDPNDVSSAPMTVTELTASEHSGNLKLIFDTRLFRGALAMIQPFKDCLGPRMALVAALKMVASFDGGAMISRKDVEAVFGLAVRNLADLQRVNDAVMQAFVLGLGTPYRGGYLPEEGRIPVSTVQQLVLPNRALDGILGNHPASHARLPVTYYELMTPQPLREFIAKRKGKLARILAARDLFNRALMLPSFHALKRNARACKVQRKAIKRLMYAQLQLGEMRRREIFFSWRSAAILRRAQLRVQSFCRLVLSKRAVRVIKLLNYLQEQLRAVWLCKRGLLRIRAKRRLRFNAALLCQRMFRGFRARKVAESLRRLRDLEIARLEAIEEAKRRAAYVLVQKEKVRHALRRYIHRRKLFEVISKYARDYKEINRKTMALESIKQDIIDSRERRQQFDKFLEENKEKATQNVFNKLMVRLKSSLGITGDIDAKSLATKSMMPSYLRGTVKDKSDIVIKKSDEEIKMLESDDPAVKRKLEKIKRARLIANLTSSQIDGLLAPSKKIPPSESISCARIVKFLKKLVGRSFMLGLLRKSYERRYDLRSNQYTYHDIRRPESINKLESRPRMLGIFHELDIPNMWVVEWDSRLATEGPSYFFNMKNHDISFEQPQGTLLCGACGRSFAHSYCGDCGTGLCEGCLDSGADLSGAPGPHDYHRVLKVRGCFENAVESLWASWEKNQAQGWRDDGEEESSRPPSVQSRTRSTKPKKRKAPLKK
jgi:hypothetical protein